jgi:hypothetical protein
MPTAHPRPWHRGSEYGPGLRRLLDREQRARFRYLLHAHHRTGRLSRASRDVGEALVRRLGADGRLDPAHTTLAEDAACSARTVRRAAVTMRNLGLLRWQTRLVRVGWRAEQTSNSYELVPMGVNPPENRPHSCGGHGGREIRRDRDSTVQTAPAAVSPADRDALERRARERQAAFDSAWLSRKQVRCS